MPRIIDRPDLRSLSPVGECERLREILDKAIKVIDLLCDHLPDSDHPDECWVWCWNELDNDAQQEVENIRLLAEMFIKYINSNVVTK